MARKKSGGGGGGAIGAVALGVVALVATVPKEVWIGATVLGIIGFVIHLYLKSRKSSDTLAAADVATESIRSISRAPVSSTYREAFASTNRPDDTSSGFRIPTTPNELGTGRWIPPGQTVAIAGMTLSGGMVYVGTALATPHGENDPCLLDPSMSVAASGDFSERQTNYWPSYSQITPSARRAYLNWLAQGRRSPDADIGYVFLFFYGLERRAIVDASKDDEAQTDWPLIAHELRVLIDVYGDRSGSFRRYASDLLDLVQLADHPTKLYARSIPALSRSYDLPLYLRLALGQASVDEAPVPATLALAWARLAPDAYFRMPATRCAEQFEKLFVERYGQAFGAGMLLPRNRTKLKFIYKPASAGFRGYEEIELTFGDVPDVAVLTAPLVKLRLVIESATKELEAYSRFVGKNPESKSSLEGLLQLPAILWPESAQSAVQRFKERMGSGMLTLSFGELLSTLDAKTALSKERVFGLARALESINIAVEPDVLAGAKLPKPEDKVVLFSMPDMEPVSRATPAYQAALLTLELSSAVAAADGEFGVAEMSHLRQQIQSWSHLNSNHQRRLLAHLRLLTIAPVTLTALKKKLEALEPPARETIAAFMVTVVQADGTVTPAELKMLEKVYKALGFDSKRVLVDVHAVTSGNAPVMRTASAESGFNLDPGRIAALQRDSEKVSNLLAGIFTEEIAATSPTSEPEPDEVAKPEGLLGLDETHTALARMLLSRPEWSRADLLDVAADLELMLDGALEQLNDASFDNLDVAFTDGEDPVKVNKEVLEKIEA